MIGRGEDKLRRTPQGGGKYSLVVEFGPRYRGGANGDGEVDLADAVRALSVLFLVQGQFPDPGSERCGQNPTSSIGCIVSPER